VSPYSYNPSNELTATPSGSYTYDNNGNTLTDASGKSYTWDFENRLVSAAVPGTGTVAFKYDPFGRRIQKSSPLGTTNYLYDGDNGDDSASVIEEVDNGGNVLARYTHGPGIDQPFAELRSGTISYYEQDGLGSVSSLSNLSAVLANTYTYDAFGRLMASTGTITNPFQYAAREFDPETGLYENRARYYDETVGRFTSEDPTRFNGGADFYVYAKNDPVMYDDPSGLIHYNKPPPDTVPVVGPTLAAILCTEKCLKCITHNPGLDLLLTGGAEQSGHSKHSFHYKGDAVDVSYFNPITTNDLFRCAENCGFGAGGDEPAKHHWHLQRTPGNGSQPLPMVYAPLPKCCS
jgi:RHS repeat-associated protein